MTFQHFYDIVFLGLATITIALLAYFAKDFVSQLKEIKNSIVSLNKTMVEIVTTVGIHSHRFDSGDQKFIELETRLRDIEQKLGKDKR